MNERALALRRRVLNPWAFRAYTWAKLPLGACAGLTLEALDDRSCTVGLPGGWRTQNPFRSTYFAAQLMAAELSTGAPAMVIASGMEASVAMLLLEVRGTYQKRIVGRSRYVFSDVEGIRAALERAAATGEPERYTGQPVGYGPDGQACSEFEVTWSFKRRTRA